LGVTTGRIPYDEIQLEGGSAFGTGTHPTARLCSQWLLNTLPHVTTTDPATPINMLDYGSGSGILSLVALLAASRCARSVRVDGVDVDTNALQVATRNLAQNRNRRDTQEDNDDDTRRFGCRFYAPMEHTPGSELWDEITGMTSVLETTTTLQSEPETSAPVMGTPSSSITQLPTDRIQSYNIIVANIIAPCLIGLARTLALLAAPGGTLALSGLGSHEAPEVVMEYERYFSELRIVQELEGWVLIQGIRNDVPVR